MRRLVTAVSVLACLSCSSPKSCAEVEDEFFSCVQNFHSKTRVKLTEIEELWDPEWTKAHTLAPGEVWWSEGSVGCVDVTEPIDEVWFEPEEVEQTLTNADGETVDYICGYP